MSNPRGNKLGTRKSWNYQTQTVTTFSPAPECSLCGDAVGRNRAVVLEQPRLTLCPGCHEAHLDDLLTVSLENDDRGYNYFGKDEGYFA